METIDHAIRRCTGSAAGRDRMTEGDHDKGLSTKILAGPLKDLVMRDLRIRPRQLRSIENVERIITVAAHRAMRSNHTESLTIEKIASEAGVTPQAAYRYFRDIDDLVRTSLRCIAVREYQQMLTRLSQRHFSTDVDLANAAVCNMLESCRHLCRMPMRIRNNILREYRQFGYDASSIISESICIHGTQTDIRRTLSVANLAAGFTASIAVATSFASDETSRLQADHLGEMLLNVFLSAIQSRNIGQGARVGLPTDASWT